MKIFITGGTGFVGSCITQAFVRERLKVLPERLQDLDFRFLYPDIETALSHLTG